jgi:hypothetical protein
VSGARARNGAGFALRSFAATIVVFVAAVPSVALADGNVEVFAGGQVDFSNYVYVGATVSFPSSSSGNGFALRGLVDTGGYDYLSNLTQIKANFGGGELDGVYQISHGNFWSDVALGVNDTYTGLTPYDPTNPLRGEQVELRVTLDGGQVSGPWRADWFGYYGPRLRDYEALLGGTHSVSSVWRLGVEVYRLYQVGPYAGISFAKNSELTFSAGEAWESGFTPRAYLRALLYQRL